MKILPPISDSKVQREQVKLLYSQGYVIQLLGIFTSFVALAIFWGFIEYKELLSWFGIIMILYIIRLYMVNLFYKQPRNSFNIEKWKWIYVVSTFFSGIVWGLLALFLNPEWPTAQQVALFIIFTGIISGAFNSNSSVFISYLAFYIPPSLILIYASINQHTDVYYDLAVLIGIYMVLMYATSLKYNKQLVNALELRFANEALANDLKSANEKLMHLADIDALSQIANRRAMDKFLLNEWEWHFKNKKPISMLVLDIDFFKEYNDTYGHTKGDKCILKIADILQSNIRDGVDLAARYGGEEFVVILHEMEAQEALNVAQKIILSLLSLKIPHQSSTISEYVTLSIGLSSIIPDNMYNQTKLFDIADKKLYKAKQSGRNKIVYS